ncbi:protoheme IX farnesyltransferase, partial [Pseudomonas aeruginosa]
MLSSLGTTFIVLATLLNLGWMALAFTSFKKNTDQNKWATKMFIYSLNYLVVFFVLAVVVSLIKMI